MLTSPIVELVAPVDVFIILLRRGRILGVVQGHRPGPLLGHSHLIRDVPSALAAGYPVRVRGRTVLRGGGTDSLACGKGAHSLGQSQEVAQCVIPHRNTSVRSSRGGSTQTYLRC